MDVFHKFRQWLGCVLRGNDIPKYDVYIREDGVSVSEVPIQTISSKSLSENAIGWGPNPKLYHLVPSGTFPAREEIMLNGPDPETLLEFGEIQHSRLDYDYERACHVFSVEGIITREALLDRRKELYGNEENTSIQIPPVSFPPCEEFPLVIRISQEVFEKLKTTSAEFVVDNASKLLDVGLVELIDDKILGVELLGKCNVKVVNETSIIGEVFLQDRLGSRFDNLEIE